MRQVSIRELEHHVTHDGWRVSKIQTSRDFELRGNWSVTYLLQGDQHQFRLKLPAIQELLKKGAHVEAAIQIASDTSAPFSCEVQK